MIDTTKEIQTTTQVEWDDIRKLRSSSSCRHLFSGKEEIHKQVLYLHVMKNKTKNSIFDNNANVNEVMKPNSYMIKIGVCKNGFLNRRRLDFKDHYHHRLGIIGLASIPILHSSSYSHHRTGSSGTILHLIIPFNSIEYKFASTYFPF